MSYKLTIKNVRRKINFSTVVQYIAVLLFGLTLVVGCNSETNNAQSTTVSTQDKKPKKVKSVPFEDLDDPEFYKTPRLQFAMQSVKDESTSIWSIKLDGSDLRRAIDPKKMFYERPGGFIHTPVRSPNRRYLAYTYSMGSVAERKMIDLKTGMVTHLKNGAGKPNFGWSKDSNILFYYRDGDIYRYFLDSKKFEKLPNQFGSHGLFTLDDGKTLAAVKNYGVAFYSYDGILVNKFDLGIQEYSKTRFTITPDGKYFFITSTEPDKIFELNIPPIVFKELNYKEKIISFYASDSNVVRKTKLRRTIFSGSMVLEPKARFLVNTYNAKIVKYNITTGEIISIFRGKGKNYPYMYTLLN